ncbi:MAG: hypothetical protein AAGI30_07135 [Planctomycetota bacterium]
MADRVPWDITPEEVDRLCEAASALYYHIAFRHAMRTGRPVLLPELLCPKSSTPCVDAFSEDDIDEAERFLLRLGIIGGRIESPET